MKGSDTHVMILGTVFTDSMANGSKGGAYFRNTGAVGFFGVTMQSNSAVQQCRHGRWSLHYENRNRSSCQRYDPDMRKSITSITITIAVAIAAILSLRPLHVGKPSKKYLLLGWQWQGNIIGETDLMTAEMDCSSKLIK